MTSVEVFENGIVVSQFNGFDWHREFFKTEQEFVKWCDDNYVTITLRENNK